MLSWLEPLFTLTNFDIKAGSAHQLGPAGAQNAIRHKQAAEDMELSVGAILPWWQSIAVLATRQGSVVQGLTWQLNIESVLLLLPLRPLRGILYPTPSHKLIRTDHSGQTRLTLHVASLQCTCEDH